MRLSKNKIYKIKKMKNQSQKKYKGGKKKRRRRKIRSFRRKKKYLNLKNKSLKFKQVGGGDIEIPFLYYNDKKLTH